MGPFAKEEAKGMPAEISEWVIILDKRLKFFFVWIKGSLFLFGA